MIGDEALQAMCRALLEGDTDRESKLLDGIATELIDRRLLNPNESLEAQNEIVRLFAAAFLESDR